MRSDEYLEEDVLYRCFIIYKYCPSKVILMCIEVLIATSGCHTGLKDDKCIEK